MTEPKVDGRAGKGTQSGAGLLEATVLLTLSVAIIIFVVTITGKFLGDENFEKLPDFIRDSYSALYSLLTAGGLAGILSVVQSRRGVETTTLSYLLYVLGCSSFIFLLIGGAVYFAPNPLERTIQRPPLTIGMDLSKGALAEKAFTISNNSVPFVRMVLTGRVSYFDGRIKGHVDQGSLTFISMPGEQPPEDMIFDYVAINICHYMIMNGQPILRFDPDSVVEKNYVSVNFDLPKSGGKPFAIPPFDFDFEIRAIEMPKLAWICASTGDTARRFLDVVQ